MNRRCFGGHDRIQLLNGRAKACEKYLPRSVAAILRALRQSTRAAGCVDAQGLVGRDRQLTIAVETGPTLEEPELLSIPLTACEGCLRDHRWQSLHVAESNVWTGWSIIRQKGASCDELDVSVTGQIQHLCWTQDGDGLGGQVGALE